MPSFLLQVTIYILFKVTREEMSCWPLQVIFWIPSLPRLLTTGHPLDPPFLPLITGQTPSTRFPTIYPNHKPYVSPSRSPFESLLIYRSHSLNQTPSRSDVSPSRSPSESLLLNHRSHSLKPHFSQASHSNLLTPQVTPSRLQVTLVTGYRIAHFWSRISGWSGMALQEAAWARLKDLLLTTSMMFPKDLSRPRAPVGAISLLANP